MSGQPVRIKPDTKERLFKFIEGKTVKRQRGRGSMKAGEGVELLLDSYYENVFIRKCFVLQHKISCCVLNFINPWNPNISTKEYEFKSVMKSIYEFIALFPIKNTPYDADNKAARDKLLESLKEIFEQ